MGLVISYLFNRSNIMAFAILAVSVQALSAEPTTVRNVKATFSGSSYNEKQLFVSKIQHKGDIAILHGIQAISESGRRYLIQEGPQERNMICKTFNFAGAFNLSDEIVFSSPPITSFVTAHETVRLKNGELMPYQKDNKQRINTIEILPCKKVDQVKTAMK